MEPIGRESQCKSRFYIDEYSHRKRIYGTGPKRTDRVASMRDLASLDNGRR